MRVKFTLDELAIQTVGKGRVWQMIAEARFVIQAAVLGWTGKRTAIKRSVVFLLFAGVKTVDIAATIQLRKNCRLDKLAGLVLGIARVRF